MSTSYNTIFMVVGSSGGHIYPALAVAESLKKQNIQVELIAPGTRVDRKILAPSLLKKHFIFMGRLNGVGWVEKITSLLRLPWVIFKAWCFVLKNRPHCVVGFGGALSGVFLLSAFLAGRKTFLFEPNACAGLANRWAGRFVTEALVVLPEAARTFKRSAQVGMPVRSPLQELKKISFNEGLRVLVLGGSQGSQFINTIVVQAMQLAAQQQAASQAASQISQQGRGAAWWQNCCVRHQTGAADFKTVQQAYARLSIPDEKVEVFEYLDPIAVHYEWANVIITRSGMGVLAELSLAARPAILVPLASAADDHQYLNAQQAVHKRAACMILQKDFTASVLVEQLNKWAQNPSQPAAMAQNIKSLYSSPQAADQMAQRLL